MALAAGTRVGKYEVERLLGAGGMGEVYRAHDPELRRDVALKVLPPEVAGDRQRMQRFQREARSAASLNHPAIAHVYEVGEEAGTHFIAMELIDGETLREKIRHDRADLKGLLEWLTHVAEGLAKAHAAGIVHRDLKPDNVMVTRDGYAKILDFGLAKLAEPQQPPGAAREGASGAATAILQEHSAPGMVMGTVGYMSPEQAQGRNQEIDHRSDVFSFGCILFEALTGQRAFQGRDAIDTLNKIIREPVAPLSAFAPDAPADLQKIVRRCLAKDPEERYQSIKDVAIELKEVRREWPGGGPHTTTQPPVRAETTDPTGGVASTATARPAGDTSPASLSPGTSSAEYLVGEVRRHRKGILVALMALLIAAAGIGYWLYVSQRQAGPPSRLLSAKPMQVTSAENTIHAAISPDGKYAAHVESSIGQQSLWIKQVNAANDIQIIPPTRGGFFGLTFSPDGTELYYAFNALDSTLLYRIPILGGTPTKLITNVDSPVTFSPDGKRLAYVRGDYPSKGDSALMVTNADGTGERVLAARKLPESFYPLYFTGPSWSPDGRLIACPLINYEGGRYVDLMLFDAANGTGRALNRRRWPHIGRVQWLPDASGLFMIAGEAPHVSQVKYISYPDGETLNVTNDLNGYRDLSLTADGTKLITVQLTSRFNLWLAPAHDPARAAQLNAGRVSNSGIVWMPDGRIVFTSTDGSMIDLWVVDADGSNRRQLTRNAGINHSPSTSRDGRYIVFSSRRDGNFNIWRVDGDGSNSVRLTAGLFDGQPSISPDGRWVAYTSSDPGKPGLWKVSIEGGDPVPLTEHGLVPAVSPDGKWIACLYYKGNPNQTSTLKLAVIPAEGGEPVKTFDLQNSVSPSSPPSIRWSADGRTLLYNSTLNNVSNVWSQPLDGGKPTQVTDFKDSVIMSFDLSPDGKQFVFARGVLIRNAVLLSEAQQ